MEYNLTFTPLKKAILNNKINIVPDINFYNYDRNFTRIDINDLDLKKKKNLKLRYLKSSFKILSKIMSEKFSPKNNLSNKYWSIIFYHWVEVFFDIYIQRYFTLEYIFKNYKHRSVSLITDYRQHIIADYSSNIFENCDDPIWNYCLMQLIFENNFDIGKINKTFFSVEKKNKKVKSKLIKKIIIYLYNLLVRLLTFNKNPKIIFLNSYMGIFNEFKYQIKNFQIPYIFNETLYEGFKPKNHYNIVFRQGIINQINSKKIDPYLKNFLKVLIIFLPKSYLENYDELNIYSKKIFFNTMPKKIFTASNYAWDDIFKRYIANNNKYNKSKIIIAQHGMGFPLEKDNDMFGLPRHEHEFCDFYFTWGNYPKSKKYVNTTVINNKEYIREYLNNKKIKHMLCIVQPHLEQSYKLYNTKMFSSILVENFSTFISNLDQDIIDNTYIKLHNHDLKNKLNNQVWKKVIQKYRNLQSNAFTNSKYNNKNLFKNTRLYLFNYPSTGFLECISSDIPCIMYVDKSYKYFNKYVYKDIKKLIDNNLVFTNYKKLSKFLNNNLLNIESWWSSEALMHTKKVFKQKYANTFSKDRIFKSIDSLNA